MENSTFYGILFGVFASSKEAKQHRLRDVWLSFFFIEGITQNNQKPSTANRPFAKWERTDHQLVTKRTAVIWTRQRQHKQMEFNSVVMTALYG